MSNTVCHSRAVLKQRIGKSARNVHSRALEEATNPDVTRDQSYGPMPGRLVICSCSGQVLVSRKLTVIARVRRYRRSLEC